MALHKDVVISKDAPKEFLLEKHVQFLTAYAAKGDEDYEFVITEYLRMNGIYWCLTALDLVGGLENADRKGIIEFIKKCQHPSGGISCAERCDSHLLHSLSAIQVLTLFDAVDEINVDGVASFVAGLQQEDGSFAGDEFGEIDTRFSFCAIACLSLIHRLEVINIDAAIDFIVRCMNFDGGFGRCPGSESHSGQIYCCLGTLAILGKLHLVDADALGWWLCERQLPSGGLNGRPEKLPDVCYSWWVLASLKIIGRLHWIDKDKLVRYILACQDDETGGIADRPGDMADPFHTLFGVAGLSLMGLLPNEVKAINPIFCMPENVMQRIRLQPKLLEIV